MVKVYGFGKEERLRKPSEFKKVLSSGRRIITPHFAFYVHRKDDRGKRLGISVSRRVGGAARRNRVKRLLREAFRLNKDSLPEGVDVVVIVRKAEGIRSLNDVTEEFKKVLGSFSGEDDT
jgi:ribonuclease P protein component